MDLTEQHGQRLLALACLLLGGCSSGGNATAAPLGDVAPNEPDGAVVVAAHAVAFRIDFHPDAPIAPGDEGLHCLDVPGPVADTYVSGWAVHRRSGIHHLNAYIDAKALSSTPAPCVINGNWILDASAPEMVWDFGAKRPGAALLLPGGVRLSLQVHYINGDTNPVAEAASIEFFAAPSHTTEVNPIQMIGVGPLSVPPGSEQTVTSECGNPPKPRDVILMSSHSHAHDTLFTVSLNDTERYRSMTWADPVISYFDDFIITAADVVSWSCTIQNTTSKSLTWGSTLNNAEMCNVQMIAVGPRWACHGVRTTSP